MPLPWGLEARTTRLSTPATQGYGSRTKKLTSSLRREGKSRPAESTSQRVVCRNATSLGARGSYDSPLDPSHPRVWQQNQKTHELSEAGREVRTGRVDGPTSGVPQCRFPGGSRLVLLASRPQPPPLLLAVWVQCGVLAMVSANKPPS